MNKRAVLEKGKLYIQLLKLICYAQFQLSCFDFFFYSTGVALRDAVHRKKGHQYLKSLDYLLRWPAFV